LATNSAEVREALVGIPYGPNAYIHYTQIEIDGHSTYARTAQHYYLVVDVPRRLNLATNRAEVRDALVGIR